MKHYGDITQINGAEITPVDIITGGSPCQDLSVAGNREGLAGERSGLFMEQVRVVKEMREHDRLSGRTGRFVRPRFMVWENVPGAFSSNKGKDFQAVLTEIVRIADAESPDVPMPAKDRWPNAGCLYDDMGRWSVAWRVHDAQFWGVPQRRKRIAVVADFGGLAAPEILFERKGVSWDSDESGAAWEGTAAGTESGSGGAISFQERAGKSGGAKESSCNMNTQEPCQPSTISPCLTAAFMGGQGSKAGSIAYSEEISPSIKAVPSGSNTVPDVMVRNNSGGAYAVDCRNGTENECVNGTLQAKSGGGYKSELQQCHTNES